MSRVLITGLGVTGQACARALNSLGYEVQIYQERDEQRDRLAAQELRSLGISITFDIPKNFPQLTITSPGWKPNHPLLLAAISAGSRVMGEIEFAYIYDKEQTELGKNPQRTWIGVTGTNGKTTTVGMVESILKADGRKAIACGNVGTTVIEILTSQEFYEYLVVELSSFQLHWTQTLTLDAAALLNIDDDHLDWHENFEKYLYSKMKIFNGSKVIVINSDDPRLEEPIKTLGNARNLVKYTLQVPHYGEIGLVEDLLIDRAFTGDPTIATEIAQLSDINPPAPHNVSNALAAAALARAMNVEPDAIRQGLRSFTPGHHRIEQVAIKDEVLWVNDSKATNPHAANAAFAAFGTLVWIAGGMAKGAEVETLVRRRHGQIRAAILIGSDRDVIQGALIKYSPEIPIVLVDENLVLEGEDRSRQLMRDVVLAARRLAQSGDTVLLAPACASMDQFESYAQRGEFFSDAVTELIGGE